MNTHEKQETVRATVAETIAELLEQSGERFHNVQVEHDHVGPKGGVSSQVTAVYVDAEDAEGVIIAVYCDDRTTMKQLEQLAERRRRAQRREEVMQLLGEEGDDA